MKDWESMSDSEKAALISAVILVLGDVLAIAALIVGMSSSSDTGTTSEQDSAEHLIPISNI